MKPRNAVDLRIAEEAAEWLYRLNEEDSPECLGALAMWLKQSPRHAEEFLMMTALSKELDAIDPERQIDAQQLVASMPANLVPLRDGGSAQAPGPRTANRKGRFFFSSPRPLLAVAAIAALFALGAIVAYWRGAAPPTFSTAIGEQRVVKLDDGSMVYMNAQSSVQIHYTSQARDVRLLRGEALFAVGRDPGRPFRVAAGNVIVRALGTQFNVLTRADGTTVSVVEGKVQVSTRAESAGMGSKGGATATVTDSVGAAGGRPIEIEPATPIQLAAGEEAEVARDGGILKHTASDVDGMIAWRQRRLVFRDDTLSHIINEFNRYNRTPRFRIEHHPVGERRYTGTFNADDPQSLKELLDKEMDLRLESDGSEVIIRSR